MACAGGASLVATGGACGIDASPAGAGAAAVVAAACSMLAAALMLVRSGVLSVNTAQLISAFYNLPGHAQVLQKHTKLQRELAA